MFEPSFCTVRLPGSVRHEEGDGREGEEGVGIDGGEREKGSEQPEMEVPG